LQFGLVRLFGIVAGVVDSVESGVWWDSASWAVGFAGFGGILQLERLGLRGFAGFFSGVWWDSASWAVGFAGFGGII